MTHTTAVYFEHGGGSLVIQPAGSVTLTGAVTAGTTLASTTTLTAGTSLLVNTTSALVGDVHIGSAKPIIISGAGVTSTPAANHVFLYFDGTDIKATNSAGASMNLTNLTGAAQTWA